MAKNLLDQIVSLTWLKLPDPNGNYDPSVYRDEPDSGQDASELTGVEKYQQRKNAAKSQKPELTGVEKYLAKKNPVETEHTTSTDELTGVAKYLAKKELDEEKKNAAKAKILENMTGVEKYLARLATQSKPKPVKKVPDVELTGVDKYLSKQKSSAPKTQAPKAAKKAATKSKTGSQVKKTEKKAVEPVVDKAKSNVSESKQKTEKSKAATPETEKKPTPKAKTASKIINLAENATQCQAATLKGTQCLRKTNLDIIQKTVNKQKYKFAVCNQHNNSDFTPFSDLLT